MFKCPAVFLVFFSGLFLQCSKDNGPDLGPYYQKSFMDRVVAICPADSVHVQIEEFALSLPQRKDITYIFEDNPALGDTMKLILKVNFGSYSVDPHPVKQVKILGDTLHLWYSYREKPETLSLNKMNSNLSVSGVETSPKLDYYQIETATIQKSAVKKVSFETVFYK